MVAEAQARLGMIPVEAAEDIKNVVLSGKITVERVKELESISDHDIAAIVEAISELCLESSKPWIHYGLTSNDVVDSSTFMQMRDVFKIIESKLIQLIKKGQYFFVKILEMEQNVKINLGINLAG